MPTREAITDSIVPAPVEKPLPTRTVSTRVAQRLAPEAQNTPQSSTNGSSAAVSAPEESVKLSPQLSALARKEQAFRQREQALKAREKEFEERAAEAEKYRQLKERASKNDYSGIEQEFGLNYENHTKYLLEQQAGEDPNSQKFKQLEDEISNLKKEQEENATKQYEETVAAYRKELTQLAETNPEYLKVKSFKDTGADGKDFTGIDVAMQFILDSFEEDGTEVTVEDALKLTKKHIEETANKWASFIDKPEAPAQKILPPPKVGSKTLTNDMQPSGEVKKKPLQYMSDEERYAEARRRVLARRAQEQQGR